ncbi:hypothetical protein BDC45DRAFT_433875, partial [Circinella umbellata]
LNGYISAIAFVINELYPKETPLAEDVGIKNFFKAKLHTDMKLPNIYQETWDVQQVITVIKKWETNEKLDIKKLQEKAVVLLYIASMWRPHSDVVRIQWQDVHFQQTINGTVTGMIIIARNPKEIKSKMSKIRIIKDEQVYPVRAMWDFKERIQDKRQGVTDKDTFFLSGINTEKP